MSTATATPPAVHAPRPASGPSKITQCDRESVERELIGLIADLASVIAEKGKMILRLDDYVENLERRLSEAERTIATLRPNPNP